MRYRRSRIPGGTYFFTVVTHGRRPFLCDPHNAECLRAAFRYVLGRHPFTVDAIVVLPNHLHCVWTLPSGDRDFSTRWRLLKSHFSRNCGAACRAEASPSRQAKKEEAVWQRPFWKHAIRDDADFRAHVEYIHYNPVKHGFVNAPKDWPYSSFH